VATESVEFCREIEAYLCKKNDGHLIRVTGPSFSLVSRWAEEGIPLKVACAGIDRYFERYYRKGPRRRPVKIDFCESDVLDVFDEWRRSVGITRAGEAGKAAEAGQGKRSPSLPAHLERVVLKLTEARAGGKLGDDFDALIDRVHAELEIARAAAGGIRGDARQALIARLAAMDEELLHGAQASLGSDDLSALAHEADEQLASYRDRMAPDAFARARDGAVSRLVRERFGLPTMTFS
jgi:hypothetical protein